MKFDKKCPKCGNIGIEIYHFHEPDHIGIQTIIYHDTRTVIDLFGKEHKSFCKPCFLTESEYQKLIKS